MSSYSNPAFEVVSPERKTKQSSDMTGERLATSIHIQHLEKIDFFLNKLNFKWKSVSRVQFCGIKKKKNHIHFYASLQQGMYARVCDDVIKIYLHVKQWSGGGGGELLMVVMWQEAQAKTAWHSRSISFSWLFTEGWISLSKASNCAV